jgi:hypothetical protein
MTPEDELALLRRRITGFNAAITDLMSQRHEAQDRIADLERKLAYPVATVVLAARHLDPEEGVMREGHAVTWPDVVALRTVLGFVSAHHECGKGKD